MFFMRFKIPETPIWLISRKRDDEAMKSLQWLRGWTQEKCVRSEFEALKRYQEYSNSCVECEKAEIKCTHPPPKLSEKLKDLIRQRNLKPFCIILVCSFIGHFGGIFHFCDFFSLFTSARIRKVWRFSLQVFFISDHTSWKFSTPSDHP